MNKPETGRRVFIIEPWMKKNPQRLQRFIERAEREGFEIEDPSDGKRKREKGRD